MTNMFQLSTLTSGLHQLVMTAEFDRYDFLHSYCFHELYKQIRYLNPTLQEQMHQLIVQVLTVTGNSKKAILAVNTVKQ